MLEFCKNLKKTGCARIIAKTGRAPIFVLVLFIALTLGLARESAAAVITSTANGGTWASGSTWVGGVAPATTDTAVISTTGGNAVTLDAAATIAGVTVDSGAILNGSSFTLTVNGNFTNNGTFNGDTGTVVFYGGSNATVTRAISITGAQQFNNVTFYLYDSSTVAYTSTFNITGSLNVGGTLAFTWGDSGCAGCSDDLMYLNGAIYAKGNITGTMPRVYGTATITLDGTGDQIIGPVSDIPDGTLTINRTGVETGVVSLSGDMTFDVPFVLQAGTFNLGTYTLYVTNSFTLSGGTLDAGTGTVVFYGGVNANVTRAISITGAQQFNNVTFYLYDSNSVAYTSTFNITGNLNVGGTLAFTWYDSGCAGCSDDLMSISGAIYAKGDVTGTMPRVSGNATITLDGTGAQAIGPVSDIPAGTLTINKPSGTANLSGDMTFDVPFVLQAGTFNLGTYTLYVTNSFTLSGGTLDAGTGTVVFYGGVNASVTRTISITGAKQFNNVTFYLYDSNSVAYTSTFNITGNLNVGGTLAFTWYDSGCAGCSDDLMSISGAIYAKGDVTGTMPRVSGNATITLDGTGAQAIGPVSDIPAGTLTINKPSGTANLSGDMTFDVPFVLQAGTFNLGTYTLYVTNSFTLSGGTLDAGTGTVVFYGGVNANVTRAISITGVQQFNNVTFYLYDSSSVIYTSTFNITGNLNVGGNLAFTYSAVSYDDDSMSINGAIYAKGNVTGTMPRVSGNATITIDGTGDQTIGPVGDIPNGAFTINKTSGAANLGGNITFDGAFILQAGTFNLGTYTLYAKNNFTNNDTINGGTGTVVFYGGTDATVTRAITTNGALFNNVTFYLYDSSSVIYTSTFNITGNLNVGGNLAFTYSAVNYDDDSMSINGAIYAKGNVTGTMPRVSGNATITLDGTGDQTIGPVSDMPNGTFTINKTSGIVSLASNFTLNGSGQDLTVTLGTLNLAGYNLSVTDALTVGASSTLKLRGSETAGATTRTYSGTVYYYGDGVYAGLSAGSGPYTNLTFSSGAGTSSWTLGAALTASGNLTIANGTLDVSATNYGVTIGGNLSNSGAFNTRSNTVTFNGTDQAISGNNTFNNLTKTYTTGGVARTLTFEAGKTQTINGTVNLAGYAGYRMNLRSSVTGTKWKFSLGSSVTKTLNYLDVQDSDASMSAGSQKPISPSNSADSGNTIAWFPYNNLVAFSGSATVLDSSRIMAYAVFDGDWDGDSSTLFEYSTSATGPWTVVTGCESVTGASPRQCLVTGLTADTDYYIRIDHTDPDGVSGIDPEVIVPYRTAPAGTVTFSGVVYADEDVVSLGSGKNVALLVNGVSAGTAVTDMAGTYSITTSGTVNAGDAVLVYIDGDTSKGATVSVSNGLDLSGFNIYRGYTITRHDNGGTLTNAMMDTAGDSTNDSDIPYTVTGGALAVTGGTLYVPWGHGFSPGGDITTPVMKSLGTFNGGSGAIDVNGSLIISNGAFTSTSGVMYIGGDLTISAGVTFTHNSGSVTLDTAPMTIDAGSVVFNNVIVNMGAYDLTIIGAMDVNGDLTVDSVANIAGNINVEGNLTLNDTLVGGAVTITLDGGGSVAIGGGGQAPNMNINKSSGGSAILASDITVSGGFTVTSGTFDVAGYNITTLAMTVSGGIFDGVSGAIDVNGALTVSGGVFNSTSGVMYVSGDLSVSGGTFNHNSGSIVLDGGALDGGIETVNTGTSLLYNVTVSLNDFTISGTDLIVTGTMYVAGNFILSGVSNTVITGTIAVAGNLTFSDTSPGTAGYLLNGTGTQIVGGAVSMGGPFTVDKPSGKAYLTADMTTGSNLTITSGTLDLEGYRLSVGGTLTVGANGTLQLVGAEPITRGALALNAGSTVIYDGTGNQYGLNLRLGNTYSNLTFNGAGYWTLNSNLDVNKNLSIQDGTLDVSSSNYSVNVAGDFSRSGTGAFVPRNGVVTLDGANQNISGSTTFFRLAKTVSAADTLSFETGSTQTIDDMVTLRGASGNLLMLRSSPPSDTVPPSAVTNLVAEPFDLKIRLDWTNPTDSDFAGVRVLKKAGGYPNSCTQDIYAQVIYDSTGTTYIDTNVSNGATYYYLVCAHDGAPNYSSGVTATAMVLSNTAINLHPSGTAMGNTATFTGGGAASVMDTNDGSASYAGIYVGDITDDTNLYAAIDDPIVPSTATIDSVVLKAIARKSTSLNVTHTISIGFKTYGTPYMTGYFTLPTSYTTVSTATYSTNPATGLAWTWTEISNLVAVAYPGGSDRGSRLITELYVTVNYTRDVAPPAEVTGFMVTPPAFGNQLNLAWTNPVAGDFAGVKLVRAAGGTAPSDCTGQAIYRDTGAFFNDTGLATNQQYSYRICSYDTSYNYSAGATGSGTTTTDPPPAVPGPATRWNFNVKASALKSISYVDVQDSDASPSDSIHKPISPSNSMNSGNNISWFSNQVAVGSGSAVVDSTTQITASAAFSADADGDSTTKFEYNTVNSWPGTTACASVGGFSPRQCVITGLTPDTDYYIRITFTDADGVSGTNPFVIGPYLTTPGVPGKPGTPTFVSSTLHDGAQALWRMDEATWKIKDASASGNDGTATNGPATTAGKLTRALLFDGADDYADTGDPSTVDFGSGDFSIEAWVKLGSLTQSGQEMIVSKDATAGTAQRQFFLMADAADDNSHKIRFNYNTSDAAQVYADTNATAISDTNWHHVAGVRSGNSFLIYVDGVSQAVTSGGTHGTMQATATPLRIGMRPYTSYESYFNGSIDEVAVWNKALSAVEIGARYNSGAGAALAGAESGLVSAWHMDDMVEDSSVNGNHGLAQNGADTIASGILNRAGSFDGVDDYVRMENSASLNINGAGSQVTIAAWIKPNTLSPTWQNIVYKGNSDSNCVDTGCSDRQYTMWLNTAGYIHFNSTSVNNIGVTQTATSTPSGIISTGQWYHVVGVVDSVAGVMEIYVNGVEQASAAYNTAGIRSGTGAFFVSHISAPFNGSVDELAIYNRALSAAEVSILHNGGSGSDPMARMDYVTWAAATAATSYRLERAPDAGGAPGTWGELAAGIAGIWYVDTGLACGNTYWYRVRGTNVIGNGPYSDSASRTMNCGLTVGAGSAVVESASRITASAAFTGDDDYDSTTGFEYNTADSWPGTTACASVATVSPRLCIITGLAANTDYYIRITHTDPDGVAGTNPQAIGPYHTMDTVPPSPVTNFVAEPFDLTIRLDWTNPSDSDFVGTRILRKTGGYPASCIDGGATVIYDSNGTNHNDTGLTNGTTYYYMACAYDGVPNYSTGVTAYATARSSTTVVFHPSGTSAGNTATFAGGGAADVMDTNDSDTSYAGISVGDLVDDTHLYAAIDDPTASLTDVLTIDSVVLKAIARKYTSFNVTHTISVGFNCGTPYMSGYFTLPSSYTTVSTDTYSTNPCTGAAWTWTGISNLVAIASPGGSDRGSRRITELYIIVNYTRDVVAPLEVTGFTVANPLLGNQLNLTWTNPTAGDFAGVKVVRAIGGVAPSDCTGPAIYRGAGVSFDDTGLVTDQPYSYRICAYDTSYNYSLGVVRSGTPTMDSTPPSNVTGFTAVHGGSQVNLSWTNPSVDFAGVKVVRRTDRYPDDSCADGVVVYNGAGSSHIDADSISAVATYYYRACAYDGIPNYSIGATAMAAGSAPVVSSATDFRATRIYTRGVTLAWSAPGYDSGSGTLAGYDVRFMDAWDYPYNISSTYLDTNWSGLRQASGEPSSPQSSGSPELFTLITDTAGTSLLPNTTYHFALKTTDDASNVSGISNVASIHTALKYGYNTVSLPYNIYYNITASDIFGDDVGGVTMYKWVSSGLDSAGLFSGTWTNVSATAFTNLSNGAGYYLYSTALNRYILDEKNSAGTTLLEENAANWMKIDLSQGRNLVGDPYLKNINFTNVKICRDSAFSSSTGCSGGTIKSFADAARAEWMDGVIGYYGNSTTYTYEYCNSMGCTAKMRPWWGQWVYLLRSGATYIMAVPKP